MYVGSFQSFRPKVTNMMGLWSVHTKDHKHHNDSKTQEATIYQHFLKATSVIALANNLRYIRVTPFVLYPIPGG